MRTVAGAGKHPIERSIQDAFNGRQSFSVVGCMRAKPLRAIGYNRVSTEEQSADGISLDMQEEKIRAYCVVQGWDLEEVLCDEGFSAKDLNRPAMDALIERIRKRSVQVVVIHKLDRLTRSIRDLPHILDLFEKSGVELASISERLDTTNATGRLMLNLLVSVSQWEREVIGERTASVLRHLRSSLRVYGVTPYGFRRSPGRGRKLIPDDGEMQWVQQMRQWRKEGLSYTSIARRLNKRGAPTKRKGSKWYPSGVRYILRNPIYRQV